MRTAAGSVTAATLGALVVMLAVELLFRLLPVPTATRTGYYVDPMILSYPPQHRWRVATGWDLRNPQVLVANNMGFPADHDFLPNADAVALVGDSYVEASMLPATSRPGAQLERALKLARQVYAMGGPGSSLLDYAERVRFARQKLGIRDVVILVEAGDARQSICGSGNVHAICLDRQSLLPRTERRPSPDMPKRVVSESALAQYFVGQLRASPIKLVQSMFTRRVPESRPGVDGVARPGLISQPIPFVDAVSKAFVERIALSGSGRTIVLVDGQRSPKARLASALAGERAYLIQRLREAGLVVVDLEPIYAGHSAVSHRSLDVGPYDGHLNAVGVQLAMQAAARALGRAL